MARTPRSQNHAGWLDGALGVIYGLEVARAFREDPDTARAAIDVASWADEEGHFGSFLGSRSFIGDVTDEEIDRAHDRNRRNASFARRWRPPGLRGASAKRSQPSDYIGYLEAHIEQGDTLDEAGLRLGVVTGIVGIRQYRIIFVGEANHAGTTRMVQRKDAGVALIKLAAAIAERFPRIAGPRSVWTTGAIHLEPGQPSIVPGRAEMMFQVRDLEAAQSQRFEDLLLTLVAEANAGPCAVTMETLWTVSPVLMSEAFQDALSRAAQKLAPGGFLSMPSGAGHDAQILARKLPAGMLFVPSIKGVSHHWNEDTSEADIVLGCQALADAAEEIARSA